MAPRSLALSLLAAMLIPVLTAAAEPGSTAPANTRPELNPRQRELLEKFDQNHDGRIDDQEKLAARSYMRGKSGGGPQERYKKALKLFDKDGDGKLNETERAEAEKAREEFQANREAVLAKFDANKDGVLNDEERASAIKAREERQKRRLNK
jgi:Ca2+-binding EF-hand superfamily protein